MEDRSTDGYHVPRSPIVDLYRLGSTYRWQVVHTSKEQSVAEHSHMVALLVLRFCQILGLPPLAYITYALLHDSEEAWIGDIATPAKRMMDQSHLPIKKMLGVFHTYLHLDDQRLVKPLVKLADDVEAMKFLSTYAPTKHGAQVYDRINKHAAGTMRGLKENHPDGKWDLVQDEIEDFLNAPNETFADDYI